MAALTACLIAMLFSAGAYLLMKRNMFEVLLGLTLVSHAANLFLLTMGGWERTQKPPLLGGVKEYEGATAAFADPIPQALILTAIVISFGVTAFLIVLVARGYELTANVAMSEEGRGEDEA